MFNLGAVFAHKPSDPRLASEPRSCFQIPEVVVLKYDSNFVLGNAQVPSYPIVYCSDGFCELTGWARAHIMQKGCACKFLHGPDTHEDHRRDIDAALDSKHELKLELIFYKKIGK
ncbi:unnamed protein product [Pieris macdunnoughi]|uniref:PAS domain-containing protein n=1 Tax=Pieris macdunnoughi TaxID=345717 RepID=A0A821MQX3_9NEOP|nr:unnamed protein product [Pieris macdunnoughi]